MSSLSIENNSEGSETCSNSGTTNHSRTSSKQKCIRDQFKAWNFHYTIQADLPGEEGVSTDEKKLLLTEHLQTRLGHNWPQAVSRHQTWCTHPGTKHDAHYPGTKHDSHVNGVCSVHNLSRLKSQPQHAHYFAEIGELWYCCDQ